MFFNSTSNALAARHIQDSEGVEYTIDYWGYAVRNFPCTNDAGSCEYLDSVYGDHYTSMIYTFILWAVLGAILLIILISRLAWSSKNNREDARNRIFYRLVRLASSATRRYLLPECTKAFKYTTRLQVLTLVILCAYLTVFSFAGITYKTWVTPVKGTNLHNIRSGIGGFADRLGAFAFALTPLTIALCSRDSVLSLLTGIPYQSFNFLHRWTGRIILVQSFIHATIWTIVEGRLYQPQPTVYVEWIKQKYMIWGIVAQSFITFLFVFSLRPVIRWTGYEFFRKSHLIVAGLYIGACWSHWEKLSCWMIASLAIMGFDITARTVRSSLLHCGYKEGNKGFGFRSVSASLETFKDPTGTVIRLTFSHNHQPWEIGQHFYLTFPALSIWQSHPFTPMSDPTITSSVQRHTYIIRACNGETRRLAALAESAANRYPRGDVTTPVILQGPYGGSITNNGISNILAISGGTGITYTLPVVMAALADSSHVHNIELVWTVRHLENLAWIGSGLMHLKSQLDPTFATACYDHDELKLRKFPIVSVGLKKRFRIRIFVTRPDGRALALQQQSHEHYDMKGKDYGLANPLSPVSSCSSSYSTAMSYKLEDLVREHPNFSVTFLANSRQNIASLVDAFMDETVEKGRTQVIGSGPPELGTQVRDAVAAQNSLEKAWRGDDRGDVECVWDDR